MNGMEKYIRDNIGSFDIAPVPEGSRERFIYAMNAERRKRHIRIISIAAAGIAAVCSGLIVLPFRSDFAEELDWQYRRLAEVENEIISIVEEENPWETEYVRNTIRAITTEAIPLEEQLPEELSDTEKKRIIKEYYTQKYTALLYLKTQYL